MDNQNHIKLFNNHRIRTLWDKKEEKWYFLMIDVVGVLSVNKNPQNYWYVLKNRLNEEFNKPLTICKGLKLPAKDGKMRLTNVSDSK
jgi:prophage antirepressor-like protein